MSQGFDNSSATADKGAKSKTRECCEALRCRKLEPRGSLEEIELKRNRADKNKPQQVAVLIKVDDRRVCWYTRGNKLAIAKESDNDILIFNL